MATLKLLLWNMEWVNDLFDQNGDFHSDTHKPQHSQGTPVRTRRNHLSGILNELVPDIVVVVEGPNREKELKLFFDLDVTGTWDVKLNLPPVCRSALAAPSARTLIDFTPSTRFVFRCYES